MKVTLNPYLYFNGNCKEAMEFYQGVLGGKLDVQTFASFGAPTVKGHEDKVMHAALTSDDLTIMASDGSGETPAVVGDNVQLSLSGDDTTKLTTYFNGLSAGGKITMPLEKQMWGDLFGMCTDKFGHHWMVNITQPKA